MAITHSNQSTGVLTCSTKGELELFWQHFANTGYDVSACNPGSPGKCSKIAKNRTIIVNVSQEKANMKLHMPSKKFIVSTFSLFVAIAVLLTVVPAVYAEGEGPLTPIPGLGRVPNATLTRMHKQEISWYMDQDALFKKANSLSTTFAALITAESKAGKNIDILQAGLDTFNAEVAASREIHVVAGNAIFTVVGFRASGDVYNRLAAGQSILDGRESLNDSHFRLIKAMADLRKSFVKWRQDRIPYPHTDRYGY
jgi:hypothetical protein